MDFFNEITFKMELQKDEIPMYLNEISDNDYGFKSGITFIPYDYFVNGVTNTSMLQNDKNKERCGLLNEEYKKMFGELEKLITKFKIFYTERIEASNYTPQQINLLIKYYMLRMRRMFSVLNPEYSLISSYEKKSKNHYHMIKGYWINNEGKRVRNISKNVANTEAALADIVTKLLKQNFKDIKIFEPDNLLTSKPDLVVFDGKQKWAVEIKAKDKETIIKTYVIFEMWRIYKEQYNLLI